MCPKGEVNVQVKHPNPRARYFPRTHGPSGEVCCSKQWPLCAEDSPLPHCLVCHSFGVSGVSSFASAFDLRHVALCAVGGQGNFFPRTIVRVPLTALAALVRLQWHCPPLKPQAVSGGTCTTQTPRPTPPVHLAPNMIRVPSS
jgi:hypothetical protein